MSTINYGEIKDGKKKSNATLLYNKRCRHLSGDGSGPKFRKVRGHSFYDVADLDAWVESAEKTAITFDKR